MIGSHARWWNDLALSGDFISFHRVGNNARGGETTSFSLFISYKKYNFADMTL